MNDLMKELLLSEGSLEELRKLSAKAGKMDVKYDIDSRADLLKAEVVYGIKQIMEEKNISQTDLADRMKKTRQYVSRILNETANFTLKTIAELTVALGVTVEISIYEKANIQRNDFKELDLYDQKQKTYKVEKLENSDSMELVA